MSRRRRPLFTRDQPDGQGPWIPPPTPAAVGGDAFIYLTLAIFTVVPIVAAVRQSPWWLCTLLTLVIWIQALRIRRVTVAPAERLLMFRSVQQQDGTS